MTVTKLAVTEFRCFREVVVEPDPAGLTVLRGPNGAGKTSLLEAVGWLATQRSFRGAPREALVRTGAPRAVLRAEADVGGRRVELDAELPVTGTARSWVNRQAVRRRGELATVLRVTVFAPEDLDLVQGPPQHRRDYLDDALVALRSRHDALVGDVERILRQRAALLRHVGTRPRLGPEEEATLAVWDDRLATAGTTLVEAREALVEDLRPLVADSYARLAGGRDTVTLSYRRSWSGTLADALAVHRAEDLRRQHTGVGPHRDELEMRIGTRPARTHASQGEQRGVALSLRLASHALACCRGPEAPVLLLDDVFSELDPLRARALVEQLPEGQVLLTTASDHPPAVAPSRVVHVSDGHRVSAALEV